jgi:hypothetical protein
VGVGGRACKGFHPFGGMSAAGRCRYGGAAKQRHVGPGSRGAGRPGSTTAAVHPVRALQELAVYYEAAVHTAAIDIGPRALANITS